MTKNTTTSPHEAQSDDTQQLSLLPPIVPTTDNPRFRLGRDTCERGLRHVAEIRELLATRQHEREREALHRLPPRRREAA